MAGVVRTFLATKGPYRDENGEVVGVIGISRDITDRKQAEETLRLRNRAIQAVSQGILITDPNQPDNPIIFANSGCERITGYTAAEYIGRNCRFLQGKDTDPAAVARMREAIKTGQPCQVEILNYRKNGRPFWNELSITPVLDPTGRLTHFVGVQTDVTERKEAEDALRAGEERYRRLLDSIPDPLFVYDRETLRYLAANNAAVASYGYSREELYEMTIADIRPPEDVSRLLAILDQSPGGLEFRGEWRHRRKDGSVFDVEITAHDIELDGRPACIVTARDLTDRKRAEEELRASEERFRQSQKMEAVGRLAGGVAHDFNNLLTIINGYGELVLGGLQPNDPNRELIREMVTAGERAAGLTRQLLAFSRKSIIEPKLLDLKVVVTDVERMLRRVVGEDIQLAVAADPEIGTVRADQGHVEQVLLNLVVNARDAMPTGGKLTIEVRNVELDETYTRDHPDARPGPYVVLAVADTGCGMDAATVSRIFEPFFSTKGEHGTGLGLATVHGIVKQSGGHVAVYSELGRGTTFKVYLPQAENLTPARGSRLTRSPLARGGETILLVEDEDGVRALTRHVLRNCGYTVLEAQEGAEALRLISEHLGRIDLLVTDVVMPRMGGREVAQRVTELHPGVKVLFLSGYTDDAIVRHGILEAEVSFLQKPFTPASLAAKIREVLDAQ
ncbi:MAG: PAS domain S-box protein [Gemmataceae bacterium]|nr:PAS domain S-box protein [Gemmataceae bacterium]